MPQQKGSIIVDVLLHNVETDEKTPDMAIYLIDAAGAPCEKLARVEKGKLEVKEEWKKLGRVVALGPDTKDPASLGRESLMQFRLEAVWPDWERLELIDITRDRWIGWLHFRVCVTGTVKRCLPWIFELADTFPMAEAMPLRRQAEGINPLKSNLGLRKAKDARSEIVARSDAPWLPGPMLPPLLHRCFPLCNGVVEVFERTCCCNDWVVVDPRLDDLLDRLREIVKEDPWPPVGPPDPRPDPDPDPFPGPRPGPDPLPFDRARGRVMKRREAKVDRAAQQPASRRLAEDLQVLESLPLREANSYVMARPYLPLLLCSCTSRYLGEALIQPDGSFSYCYRRPLVLYRFGRTCTTTYAYRVRQWQENQWVYVYNGLFAHEYFGGDENAELVSHSPKVRPCETDPPPVEGQGKPFVLLQDVGDTNSFHMISPVQNSLDGINAVLPDNGGLVSPPPSGRSAVWQPGDGAPYNRPWSKTLSFRLYVHPHMQALGAKYFRISVVGADGNGNPLAGETPQPLTDPVSWRRYVYIGSEVQVKGEGLGPHALTDGNGDTQPGLYEIPYWDLNHQWLHGQYHHSWNTNLDPNGRYLVSLEVFDSAGNRLRPNGAVGDGIDKDFDFLRWIDSENTVKVPFAAMQHLFWADKQPCYGDIEDLRKDGLFSVAECQFMSGTPDSLFSAGFRAFHANGPSGEPFMWYYTIWYHRGLNGPNRGIQTSGENAPGTLDLGPPATTVPQTFGSMLDEHSKCTFALNLRVHAKHTNGKGRIQEYDRSDQAAFALEAIAPTPSLEP